MGPTASVRVSRWPTALVALALVGWWWSVRMAAPGDGMGMADGMSMTASMSLASFLLAWVAMMAAMMFPAVVPVVRLYGRAAGRGVTAPTPLFVSGYLLVWAAAGAPAWFAWRALEGPLGGGEVWAVRLSGLALVVAAAYQLTPLKSACLRQCRSPMGFFMRVRGDLSKATVAIRVGAQHGTVCLGCCWALMVVLVTVGTMNIVWMAALTVVIFVEKVLPRGEAFGRATGVAMAVLGLALLGWPMAMGRLV